MVQENTQKIVNDKKALEKIEQRIEQSYITKKLA
ncbi:MULTISPECIES: FbpB family small basic protein [unclassified Bacillus (in: firmicutes)]